MNGHDSLSAAGMSGAAIAEKTAMLGRIAAALGGSGIQTAWFVPGRIEVLGKHTDYAGGRSLLAAAERGFCVAARPRDDDRIVMTDAGRGSTFAARLDPDLVVPPSGWKNYGMTVVRRVARDFPDARRGADIALASDLPSASGMSSSSAMMIAVFLALADVNGLPEAAEAEPIFRTREQLAAYLSCVENGQTYGAFAGDRGVGTAGGSEDHTAILCSVAGRLAQYAFCPVRLERIVHLDADHVFAIAVSGISASKTGSAQGQYNNAAGAVARMLALWRHATGRTDVTLADALASMPNATERVRELVGDAGEPALLDRFEQFLEESERIVLAAGDCLVERDVAGFGTLVDRSQSLAERGLGNQVPETIELARSARECGALAASAFGAGFGGSVWALVPVTTAPDFLARWASSYKSRFPAAARRATFFATRPGPGATRLMANGRWQTWQMADGGSQMANGRRADLLTDRLRNPPGTTGSAARPVKNR